MSFQLRRCRRRRPPSTRSQAATNCLAAAVVSDLGDDGDGDGGGGVSGGGEGEQPVEVDIASSSTCSTVQRRQSARGDSLCTVRSAGHDVLTPTAGLDSQTPDQLQLLPTPAHNIRLYKTCRRSVSRANHEYLTAADCQ